MYEFKKNTRVFKDFSEYFDYYDHHEHKDYITDIVDTSIKFSADAEYSCKTFKTVIKRFFNAISDFPGVYLDGWEECITESCENGCFSEYAKDENGKSLHEWAYSVEQTTEGSWYISLIIFKHN